MIDDLKRKEIGGFEGDDSYIAGYNQAIDDLHAKGLLMVWQPTHRHVNRGTDYQLLGSAKLQNHGRNPLFDDAEMVVYRGEDGKLWVRHTNEFNDGRFYELQKGDA